jgi:hypothetical protein
MIGANDHPSAPGPIPPQYSVRDLLTLTLVVAIVLTIGVLCQGSRYFGAFFTLWASVALVPIVAVWLSGRWRLVPAPWLAHGAVILYFTSMCVPALTLGGDLVFGWMAWLLSFVGVLLFSDWQMSLVGEQTWYPVACTMGAAVNVAFVIAYVAHLLSNQRPRIATLARRIAKLGSLLALLVLFPLGLSGELDAIYPAYGMWAASVMGLYLSTGATSGQKLADCGR